MNTVHSP